LMTVYEDIVKLVANHLRCSICYEIFVKPVTLLCGHNYCQKCMQGHLQKNPCCPECRTKVGAQLKKNITLCNILEIPEAGGRDLWDQVLTRAEQDVRHEGHTGTRTQRLKKAVPGSKRLQLTGYKPVPQFAGSSGFALLTFSPQLGHRRLVFRPDQRRIEVRHSHAARAAQHYFSVCQWMAEQEFASGSHHWDVDTTDCRAWAVGVAHADLRQDQRLGRSPTSWCIEWSSKRLSAWIAGVEMRLEQRQPSRVRVLLDMADGQLAFWSLSDREAELYSVQVEFRAPVRPVFWLFGTQEKNALYFPAP
uniref:RING-type domain-containing protein n=1 Tax=Electrophorus electricus TaxID=8005 RepID=A0A4W4EK21_ELEEL